jgi:hypothetical protein
MRNHDRFAEMTTENLLEAAVRQYQTVLKFRKDPSSITCEERTEFGIKGDVDENDYLLRATRDEARSTVKIASSQRVNVPEVIKKLPKLK